MIFSRGLGLFCLALLLALPAAAQIDTTGGKFYRPLYAVSASSGVAYGAATNVQGATQTLLMDVYEPVNGPAGPRPVIILAHGGGFVFGSRANQDVTELCRRFARLGYVTASIDYRLNNFSFTSPPDANALVRAMHDMRAAVRFFRQDAATANVYKAAPDYLFVGGSSAGAFTALNTAFLDRETELLALGSTEAGGVEGQSGNSGYASTTRAAINLCGALGLPTFIEAGNAPFVSLHGNRDAIVPYAVGTSPFNPASTIYGSGALKVQATAVGVPNPLYPFQGAGHVPFAGTSPAAVAYMDTTFRFVRDFLRPLLAPAADPLPVTLTRFDATRQGGRAVLSWQTATETNNRGYEVQASVDGRTFRVLGFVAAGAAEAAAPRRYRFVDERPGKAGLHYYRLRQVDLDGKSTLYGPRTVDFGDAPAGGLAAYPNPFSTELTAIIPAAAGGQLRLRDARGRLVVSQVVPANQSPTRQPMALPASLRPGLYVLTLTGAGQPQQLKLLKQ